MHSADSMRPAFQRLLMNLCAVLVKISGIWGQHKIGLEDASGLDPFKLVDFLGLMTLAELSQEEKIRRKQPHWNEK